MNYHFTRHHLLIASTDYKSDLAPSMPSLTMDKAVPSLQLFQLFLDRVGGPWNWPLRQTYHSERQYWADMMSEKETQMFILRRDNMPIGFCHVGSPRADSKAIVNSNLPSHEAHWVEIKHFGFFEEETGKGYGHYFLPRIFDTLLKDYDTVYLNTRDTNHPRVVPFYQDMGMSLIHSEIMQNDLITAYTSQNKAA